MFTRTLSRTWFPGSRNQNLPIRALTADVYSRRGFRTFPLTTTAPPRRSHTKPMDAVAQLKETDVGTILFPTVGIFAPLLESRRAEIKDAVKTYKYGATDRHQLDVYLPSSQSGTKAPILFFLYGGGFVQGARQLPAPIDLAYGNLGTYFAKHGFVTVVADYQLAPSVTFPAPAEDLRDAVAWVVDNAAEVGSGKVELDTEKVFVIGHSAGGVHLLTSLLHPPVLAGPAGDKYKKALKGAVALSPPYRSGLVMLRSGSVRFFAHFCRTENLRFGSKSGISEPRTENSVRFGSVRPVLS
ncbi:Esterase lipase thioesterase family protein [Mycena chlorophos]|uniref:Esterase lipase thioesterase family protein n=1 Tax=Mycena chlorophos TaxID=658473 RepID=A0A8H6WH48_MYCCL|nr:Esterase lipase thioesterase family protein [Mycena chlorophos]